MRSDRDIINDESRKKKVEGSGRIDLEGLLRTTKTSGQPACGSRFESAVS
jgi:hypothetical protein